MCRVAGSCGSHWERRHLLFRDWLRRDRADRDRYGRVKQELAAGHWTDMNAYADAKTGTITAIMERAERWRMPPDGGSATHQVQARRAAVSAKPHCQMGAEGIPANRLIAAQRSRSRRAVLPASSSAFHCRIGTAKSHAGSASIGSGSMNA